MKIGWVKYTGNLELGEHLLFTAGTTNIRTNLFKAILNKGIDLVLYSPVGVATQKYLSTPEGKKQFGKIQIKYTNKVDDDVDFLVIENGTDNTNFSWNIDGVNVPSVAYTNRLISNYEGVCFYLQTDPALPFIFFPEFYSLKYLNKYIKFGNIKSLLENKEMVILSSAKNEDEFFKINNKNRASYIPLKENGLISYERLETHYTCLEVNQEFKIKKKTNAISYIGGQRARTKKFTKFLGYAADNNIPVEVWGKWKDGFIKKQSNINWMGILDRGKVYETYNKSFGSVVMGDLSFEKLGYVSGRFFEIIGSKTLPLIDVDLLDSTMSDILPNELIKELTIYKGEDVIKKYNDWNGSRYRRDLIRECIRSTRGFNSETVVDDFIYLLNKYKNKTSIENFDKKISSVMSNLIKERKTDNTYSRLHYDQVVKSVYKIKNNGVLNYGRANVFEPNANFKKEEDDLVYYDKKKRCSRCGSNKIDMKGKSVYASNIKCRKCENNIGNFESRLFKILKKVTRRERKKNLKTK